MKFIVNDLITIYEKKIVKAYKSKFEGNSNYKKEAQRYEYLLQFVKTLPLDFVIDCEKASSKNADEPNAGSLTEIALEYHYYNNDDTKGAKSAGTADIDFKNGQGVEIKLSLNGSCYNTPIAVPMRVYLVNRDGVYIIEKKDVDEVIECYGKSGHLPFTEYEGARMHKTLSRALGYNVD